MKREKRNEQIAIVTYAQNIFDDNEIIEGKRNINDLVTYVAPTKWGFSR